MEQIIVTFRSRAHTVRFCNFIRNYGFNCLIVNTPKEANVGCGLSVEITPSTLPYIKKLIREANLSSYVGVFKVFSVGGQRKVRSI